MTPEVNQNNIFSKITLGLIFSCLFLIVPHFTFANAITGDTLVNLVNQKRIENNLNSLEKNLLLDRVAQQKLDDMVANNYSTFSEKVSAT